MLEQEARNNGIHLSQHVVWLVVGVRKCAAGQRDTFDTPKVLSYVLIGNDYVMSVILKCKPSANCARAVPPIGAGGLGFFSIRLLVVSR